VPAPTDSAVTAFFEAHKSDPQYRMAEAVKLRHIQVASEAEAKAVLAKLKKGADFAKLAKETSTDAATKGEGGLVARLERNGGFSGLGPQPALTDTAFKAPLNVPIGPLRSTVGWHVIEVEEKIPAEAYPIENMRPRILQMLGRQTQEEYYKQQLEKAKQAAGFRLNQVAVDSFLVGKRSASDLFREAQDASNPDDRISGYERVVHDFPKSDQAPQAEFMIGFVYSEEKKDYDKAEAAFKKLLADYPKSELRHSAEWMLANMRSDAVPDFDLPGGVKRAAVDSTAKAPGTTPQVTGDKGRPSNGNKK